LGIRKDCSSEYLWKPNDDSTTPWWRVLQHQWGSGATRPEDDDDHIQYRCCEYCAILPINNGNESRGESLVADFETALFRGTLLLRLRHAEGTTQTPSDDSQGYFAGKPFRYQAIVRGRFTSELPYTHLVTGTRLDRPCGKLPPKWVLWTALKVVGFFAPQLKTKLDGVSHPYSLSPLGSAPRTVVVDSDVTHDGLLGDDRVEPTTPENSLTGVAYPISNPLERARARKRHFDQWFLAKRADKCRTDPSKVYTMEFLQHLFDYQKFSIDLGNNFHANIQDILDGQPLQLMAAHTKGKDNPLPLWSFEIWNESLLKDAKKHMLAHDNN
jgi:hypothetical protein